MKRYLLILYILLLTFTLGAANPAQVSITLTTKVPGYLYHGFLSSESSNVVNPSANVADAFNPLGAVLNYGIKTNTGLPLIVKATITDFSSENVPNANPVRISQVKVGSTIATYIISEDKYKLLELQPTSGTVFYPYTLTVYANQTDVQNSPQGDYQSTVKIDIAIND